MISCVVGASGRLGRVVEATFRARGDEISPFPDKLNYLVFAHRWRAKDGPNRQAEFAANVWMVADTIEKVAWEPGDCAIVVVSSVAGHEPASNQSLAYSLSKAAQHKLARHYRHTHRINTVSPDTFTGEGAVISAQQVADVIAFLCSPYSSGINGQDIRIG